MRKLLIMDAMIWFILVFVVVFGIFAQQRHESGLPHRAATELTNWGQGHAPEMNHCPPGTIRVDTEEGWFLECFRGYEAHDPTELPPQILALIKRFGPPSTTEWHRFDSLDAAALYAAGRLEKCSHYYECSGLIVVDPKGKFTVGPVRTDYQSDSVSVSGSGVPSDWVKAAAVHSHPCVPNHYTYLFSPQDVMGAIGERIINFMVDVCSGAVHKFDPAIDRPDVTQVDGIWMTGGRLVGYVTAYPNGVRADEGI